MKNVKEKVGGFLNSTKTKIGLASTAVAMAMANPYGLLASNDKASGIVKGIAGTVIMIFPLVGIFFVIAGVFKLVLAYRNDQPESQTAAAKDIVIGAVLIGFSIIWDVVSGLIF